MIRERFLTLAAVAVTVVVAAPAWAAGPKNVNGAGTPLAWAGQPTPIPFNPDLGTLGARTNAQAVSDITADFGVWDAVSTASLSFTNSGNIGVCANGQGCVAGTQCSDLSTCTAVDVTLTNYSTYLVNQTMGLCGDGLSPIIFDTDGTIMSDLFGPGANNSVVAVAHPDCTDDAVSTITEGSAILNGRFLDGVSNGSNPELTLVDYSAVVIREFGHYLNLDNSQINLTEATDTNTANDNAVATMYPFLIHGTEQATLNLDDRVSVSALYPAPAFASSFGTITGSVLLPNKEGAFQGAYVIARLVGDPRISAVGAASGARFFPHNDGGLPNPGLRAFYELPGLPPGDYTVQIEAIDPNFTGAAAVGPLDPPEALPIPELWNGECPPPGTPTPAAGCESNTDPPDNPTQSTVITVTAGATVSNINFILNGAVTGPVNDACTTPTVISPAALPFSATLSTTTATIGIFDPLLSCILVGGADQNTNSVWYSFTPVLNGTVVADTTGSDYDTALAAYTGGCGALTEVTCNDDVDDVTPQSQITFPVIGGTTYLIEPTHYFIDTSGGSLHFALAFTPAPSTPTTTPTTTPTRTPTRTPTTPGAPTSTPTNTQPTATTTPTRTVTPTPSATASGTPTATPIPGGFTVGGQIRYYSNALAVQNVEVHVEGAAPSVVNTDSNGAYSVPGLSQTNWTFEPIKHGDAGAAISALDASFILQFLVGLHPLSPEAQLACDTSGNGSLTAFDAAFILQYLVGLVPALPVTQSCGSDWEFIPVPASAANQTLIQPQPTSGNCQHGAIAFTPLVSNASGQDFTALLFGDCSGNWKPPVSGAAVLSPRQLSSRPIVRLGDARRGRAGTVRFPLIVESEEAFYALSARIDFDPDKLRLLGVRTVGGGRSALLQANNAEAGTLLIALANAQPMAAGSASTVLLEFEPQRAGSAAPPHIHGAWVDERSAQ